MTIMQRQDHTAGIGDESPARSFAAVASPHTDFSCVWTGKNGHFTASPWEGLVWEADPEDPSTAEDPRAGYSELGRFLMSSMYGE